MNHCIAASDVFQRIEDPYNGGHICFKCLYPAIDRREIVKIVEDPKFLFLKDNVFYFNPW